MRVCVRKKRHTHTPTQREEMKQSTYVKIEMARIQEKRKQVINWK